MSLVGHDVLKVVYSPVFLEHKPPFPHPERPERLEIAVKALKKSGLEFKLMEPKPAQKQDLYRAHEPTYVDKIERYVETGMAMLDSDTYLSPGTLRSALTAAGAALGAAEALKRGCTLLALSRPPGHHAGRRGAAMGALTQGFCIFNNVALAAARLFELGLKRVAVIDFDAHHGNGTQEIFYSDPKLLHVDIHEDPVSLYPGTGFPTELGDGEGEGTKVNMVLPPGGGDDVYALALEEVVVPLVEEFKPEALLFSAGFDAYKADGLTHLQATEWTFARIGSIARWLTEGKTAVFLEGGYSLGLENGLPAFASALCGLEMEYPLTKSPEPVFNMAKNYVYELKALLKKYWKL